jgi:hypothetical protein
MRHLSNIESQYPGRLAAAIQVRFERLIELAADHQGEGVFLQLYPDGHGEVLRPRWNAERSVETLAEFPPIGAAEAVVGLIEACANVVESAGCTCFSFIAAQDFSGDATIDTWGDGDANR